MSTALATAGDVASCLLSPDELFARINARAESSTTLENLFHDHAQIKARLEQVADYARGALNDETLGYFIRGNSHERDIHFSIVAEKIFNRDGAIRALDANFWERAIRLTDVFQVMNNDRRTKWTETIRKMETPEFTPANVHSTLGDLLAMRPEFLAERVDGLFRALSGEHVTNRPQAFGTRMIINYIHNGWHTDSQRTGYISDLRCVVAKFMGREEPKIDSTYRIIDYCREQISGEWLSLDGGTLRIRVYKKGTAHLEVHPEMAWRLNAVLAHKYPRAIAAEFRTKPTRRAKDWPVIQRPLPVEVRDALASLEFRSGKISFPYFAREEKRIYAEAVRVIGYLGGVVGELGGVEFDYPAETVLRHVVASGCLPDAVSHQFYPTPENLASIAVELADIESGHCVLEPSAGQGAIADKVRACCLANLLCVEISELHAAVLRAKGHATRRADFISFAAENSGERFERVIMNPPFSDGRWIAHTRAAAALTSPGGRLVAILPSSATAEKLALGADWTAERRGTYANEFDGTSVSVSLFVCDKRQQ